MRRFICIITFLCMGFIVYHSIAQPPARRAEQQKKNNSAPALSVRAQTQYTGQMNIPEEVVWKREIYRILDLNKDENAALYFPVEPIGNRMNLFTYMFKLILEDKIPVYEYRMDGNENLIEENKTTVQDLLDRFHIYYEERVEGRDTTLIVDNSDIPSSEVLSYYIKEDWYFDHHTSTYDSKVVAICPVIHRAGDFSMEATLYPMFWLDYKDLSPYLSRMPIMTSNLNNTSNQSIDDYFVTNKYKGDIYKTTNMFNRTLRQYCESDSLLIKEQQKIEGQLEAFRKNLWESTCITPEEPEPEDTLSIASDDAPPKPSRQAKAKAKNSKKVGRDKAASSGSSKSSVNKSSSKSSSSAPRASVRRQRR